MTVIQQDLGLPSEKMAYEAAMAVLVATLIINLVADSENELYGISHGRRSESGPEHPHSIVTSEALKPLLSSSPRTVWQICLVSFFLEHY